VLVLGESHYDESFGQGDGLTSHVVRCHVECSRTWPFFDRVGCTIAGPTYGSPHSRRGLWDNVAFYNYVPSFAVGRPTAAQFNAGWEPFQTILAELQPDVVLAFGYTMWGFIRRHIKWQRWLEAGGTEEARYTVLRQAAPGAGVIASLRHPSRGYSADGWRPVTDALLHGPLSVFGV
jgi:hypothetical protein